MSSKNRITSIDFVRGIALILIIILHHIGHFNFYLKPNFQPNWLESFDYFTIRIFYYIVAEKAFGIFSILFGWSFYLMYSSKIQLYELLRKHIPRMGILIGFGFLHLVFYKGDILIIYGIIGVFLPFFSFLKPKLQVVVIIVLLVNPLLVYNCLQEFINGVNINKINYVIPNPLFNQTIANGSFIEVCNLNFSEGIFNTLKSTWIKGRAFSIAGFFGFGYFIGKQQWISKLLQFKKHIFIASAIIAFLLLLNSSKLIDNKSQLFYSISYYINIFLTFIYLWSLIYFYLFFKNSSIEAMGRMGLTNYVLSSIIGTFIYYGWGLKAYEYTGYFLSLLISLLIILFQVKFSKIYINKFKQGPLEYLWRKCTSYLT